MKKAILELKNKHLINYLKSLDFMSFDQSDKYDILFCDDLNIYNPQIKSSTKVYIADYRIENLDKIDKFQDFEYFIGFGDDFYFKLNEYLGVEISKTFNDFICDMSYENKFEDNDFDIFISTSSPKFNRFEFFYILDIITILMFFKKNNVIQNIKIGTNQEKFTDSLNLIFPDGEYKNFIQKKLENEINFYNNEVIFTDFCFPQKYFNNSKCVIFLSLFDSRLYFCEQKEKVILPNLLTSYFSSNEDLFVNSVRPVDKINKLSLDCSRWEILPFLEEEQSHISVNDNDLVRFINFYHQGYENKNYLDYMNYQKYSSIPLFYQKLIDKIKDPLSKVDNIKNSNNDFENTIRKIINI